MSGGIPSINSLSLVSGIIRADTSLTLGDICHHHLAVGILIIIVDYVYINIAKYHIKRVLESSPFSTNYNIKLSILLIFLSLLCGLTSQQLSTLIAYPNLSYNYII